MAAIKSDAMKHVLVLMLIVFSVPVCYGKEKVENKLVKRIDHISIYYNSIREVDAVIHLFNEVLNLPMWISPGIVEAANDSSTKYYTTGVYLGNVFLEFITRNIESTSSDSSNIKPTSHAIALTNEISNTAEILDQRDIKRSRKYHFACNDISGSIDTLFTNIIVREISNKNLLVFFCQYHQKIFDCSSFDFRNLPNISDPDDQHKFYWQQLNRNNGGFLKINYLDKIVLSTNSNELHQQIFDGLLPTTSPNNIDYWKMDHGPGLSLVEGEDELFLKSLYINVESLDSAKEFIEKEDLGYEIIENSMKLSTLSSYLGLNFYLIE